jgi:hypothetical protein
LTTADEGAEAEVVTAARFVTAGVLALTVPATVVLALTVLTEEEALLVEAACAGEDAGLTVTVFVKVVVVIFVDVVGTQLVVARRSTPRCPELICVERRSVATYLSAQTETYRRSGFYDQPCIPQDYQNRQGDRGRKVKEHDVSQILVVEVERSLKRMCLRNGDRRSSFVTVVLIVVVEETVE